MFAEKNERDTVYFMAEINYYLSLLAQVQALRIALQPLVLACQRKDGLLEVGSQAEQSSSSLPE